MLLFRFGPREQFAAPLALIRRVERVRMDRVERVGDREFLTVDGVPTAVLRLDRVLAVSPGVDREEMFLLLPKHARRPLGVLVSEVIDSDELPIELHRDAFPADGLLGSAVVRGQLTLFLDLPRLAELGAMGGRPDPADAGRSPEARGACCWSRTPSSSARWCAATWRRPATRWRRPSTGRTGSASWTRATFDLVVSDMEMPVMDGFEFARAVRRRPGGAALPLMALTTLDSQADRERAAGVRLRPPRGRSWTASRFLAAAEALLRRRGRREVRHDVTGPARPDGLTGPDVLHVPPRRRPVRPRRHTGPVRQPAAAADAAAPGAGRRARLRQPPRARFT